MSVFRTENGSWHLSCYVCLSRFVWGGGSMNIVDRKYKILLVDDEPAILSSVQNLFSDQNEIEIQIAKNSEEVMTAFNKAPYEFAVVLMDYNLAGISGAELTKEIIKINPHQIVAMYSGDESQRAAIESWLDRKIWKENLAKRRIQTATTSAGLMVINGNQAYVQEPPN